MVHLRHFGPDEIKVSNEQAARLLRYFFPGQPIDPGQLTNEDRGFSQALLIEAVDASTEMGYVQTVFEKFYGKPPVDFSFIEDIAKTLCKQAFKNWFRHATGKDLSDPKIYESVRAQLSRSFKSAWAIRMQSGDLTY